MKDEGIKACAESNVDAIARRNPTDISDVIDMTCLYIVLYFVWTFFWFASNYDTCKKYSGLQYDTLLGERVGGADQDLNVSVDGL
jgi:hypothetical protein